MQREVRKGPRNRRGQGVACVRIACEVQVLRSDHEHRCITVCGEERSVCLAQRVEIGRRDRLLVGAATRCDACEQHRNWRVEIDHRVGLHDVAAQRPEDLGVARVRRRRG